MANEVLAAQRFGPESAWEDAPFAIELRDRGPGVTVSTAAGRYRRWRGLADRLGVLECCVMELAPGLAHGSEGGGAVGEAADRDLEVRARVRLDQRVEVYRAS